MSTILKNLIQLIKNETLPSANTAIRVGTTLEYIDTEKADRENTYTKSEVMDLVNEIKLLASSDAKFIGSISPTTPINPDGNIWAFAEAGTYPNSGGLVVNPNTLTILSRAGGVWSKIEVELPSNAAEKVFNPLDDVKPSTMKAAAKRWDKSLKVLSSFLETNEDVETLEKTFDPNGVDYSLFGINDDNNSILNVDNSYAFVPNFHAWKNIPLLLSGKRITRIKGAISLTGNDGLAPKYKCNILGIKDDGTMTPILMYNQSPPPNEATPFNIDVSEYKYVSINIAYSSNVAITTDQYIEFYTKTVGATIEENAVKKYINTRIAGAFGNQIDLIDFGCIGDGLTDDTNKINTAVLLLIAQGGGKIFLRDKKYKVSSVRIPNVDSWCNIIFEGAYPPAPRFGTVGNFPAINGFNGAEFISDLNDPSLGVINVNQGNWAVGLSNFLLTVKNMNIRAYDIPNCQGINAYHAATLVVENVNVGTGVYNPMASEPTNASLGIVTPKQDNSAYTLLRSVNVYGFRDGIVINEHTDGDAIVVSSCYNGLVFYSAVHASYFNRVCAQRNRHPIKIVGKHLFEIAQLNLEYAGSGQYDANTAWQNTQFELLDPSNLGYGKITYANVKGNLGAVDTFRISGGANVIVKKVGSDVRLTGSGIAAV